MRFDRQVLRGTLGVMLWALCTASCGDDAAAGAGGSDGGSQSGAAGSTAGTGAENDFDACALVTEADATAVFEHPAMRDPSSNAIVDPAFLGECNWTYEETDDSTGAVYSQSIFFSAWNSPAYNAPLPDSEPLGVGQDGWATVSEGAGVSIGWVQGGRSYSLGYFSIGPTMPDNASKLDAMKMLAIDVGERL